LTTASTRPDEREDVPDAFSVEPEAPLREKRKRGLESGKGGRDEKEHEKQRHQAAMPPGPLEQVEPAARHALGITVAGFRQQEQGRDEIAEAQDGSTPHRCRRPEAREHPAERRPDDETKTERRAHESHPFRPVLVRRNVRDVCLRRRNVAARNPADNARREDERQRIRQRQRDVGGGRRQQATKNDRASPDPV
jgi:hypothetical protein